MVGGLSAGKMPAVRKWAQGFLAMAAFAMVLSAGTFLAPVAARAAERSDRQVFAGDVAPPFVAQELAGQEFSLRAALRDFRQADVVAGDGTGPGGAVVMVFFTMWSQESVALLAPLQQLGERWESLGVRQVFVGVAHEAEALGDFVDANIASGVVLPDPFSVLARRYGATHFPDAFVISGDGRVAVGHSGAAGLVAAIQGGLREVFGERAAAIKDIAASSLGLSGNQAKDSAADTRLRFGRAPSAEDAAKRWRPLAIYLSSKTRARVEMEQNKSYAAFEKSVLAGEFDLFNAGPLQCNQARDLYEPVVTIEREGQTSYLGMMFVSRRSVVKDIKGLRGKTIGMVSPASTSGGLYPHKLLLDAGLRPLRDVHIKWMGSHEKVAIAVKRGWVHAGACFEDCRDLVWRDRSDKVRQTRVLDYTVSIPSEMIMMRRDLPEATRAALRKALLEARSRPELLMQISQSEPPITSLHTAKTADLDSIAAVVKQVKTGKRK